MRMLNTQCVCGFRFWSMAAPGDTVCRSSGIRGGVQQSSFQWMSGLTFSRVVAARRQSMNTKYDLTPTSNLRRTSCSYLQQAMQSVCPMAHCMASSCYRLPVQIGSSCGVIMNTCAAALVYTHT